MPLTATFTPLGTLMGCFPILDIFDSLILQNHSLALGALIDDWLADLAQDFTAHVVLAALAIREQTLGR